MNSFKDNDVSVSIVIPTLGCCCIKTRSLVLSLIDVEFIERVIVVNQGGGIIFTDSISNKVQEEVVGFRGVSRARNFGASLSSSEYVVFLDDDVTVTRENLFLAINILNSSDFYCGLSGTILGNVGNVKVSGGEVVQGHLTGRYIESALVFRRSVFLNYLFDESFGSGSFYGSCEGHDLILRMLRGGERFLYFPEYVVGHHCIDVASRQARLRYFSHGLGMGGCYLKNFDHSFFFNDFFRTLLGAILYLLKGQLRSRYSAKFSGIVSALILGLRD